MSASAYPGATGREGPEHAFITITASTLRPPPYRMCSKCGEIRTDADLQRTEQAAP